MLQVTVNCSFEHCSTSIRILSLLPKMAHLKLKKIDIAQKGEPFLFVPDKDLRNRNRGFVRWHCGHGKFRTLLLLGIGRPLPSAAGTLGRLWIGLKLDFIRSETASHSDPRLDLEVTLTTCHSLLPVASTNLVHTLGPTPRQGIFVAILRGEHAVDARKAVGDPNTIMTEQTFSLPLQFPGARLTRRSEKSEITLRPRIGWYLRKKADINTASARYRCFHFARALSDSFESTYFTLIHELEADIDTLDAIVVVKRLDSALIELVALAQRFGKPIFLDLCDDLMHPRYPGLEGHEIALATLRAISPVVAGIVVPSAEMAERVTSYFPAGTAPPCHVIPDIAETGEEFSATAEFIRGRLPEGMPVPRAQTALSKSGASQRTTLKRVVWFGSFGGPHSNFGLFSLRVPMKHLRAFHKEIPLELVVISNSKPVFDALVYNCGFPTRYVPWSSTAVYEELQHADAALLTTGTDDFCTVKSSNRVIQALACGVPVIAEKSAALAEFEGAVLSGKMQQSLDICLRPEKARIRAERMDEARRILARYTPEALARSWALLLSRAIGKSLSRKKTVRRSGLLFVLDPDDKLDEVIGAIKAVKDVPGLNLELLVSTELLEQQPKFAGALRLSKSLPKFYSKLHRALDGGLGKVAGVVFGSRNSEAGKILRALAEPDCIQSFEFGEVPGLDLTGMISENEPPSTSERASPGPYPQHLNPDGSVEWAFVIHGDVKGWILDAICHEIGSRQPAAWKVVGHRAPPPPAKNLFFSHYSLLERFDATYPEALEASQLFVWYTHPREESEETITRSLDLFSRTTKVIFTCEANRALWVSRGLDPNRTAVVLGGADPSLFYRHERGGGCVGLSSSFYERKNPDLLFDVIKALPHRHFTLLGRNWNRYARFEEMLDLPNFTYLSAPYREYPRIYATFDVFLSISMLEGGPIPLIEAMMCNAVPVSSNTGFAPDLITHADNGFLFDVNADAAEVSALIEKAFSLPTDVRATVLPYSWDEFSAQIMELAR